MKITIPESSGYVTECPVTLDGETRVFPVGVEIDVPEAWASVINDMLNSQKKEQAKPYVDTVVLGELSKVKNEAESYTDKKVDEALYVDENEVIIPASEGSGE